MVKRLLSLSWKKFWRSAAFSQKLALKILLIFIALYFILSFGILGASGYFLLRDTFPDKDPLNMVNNYLIFWFLLDLIYRFLLQKMPVLDIKPLMVLPIPENKIIHFLLRKYAFSFYNFLPLFFFFPFTIVLLAKGYAIPNVLGWFFSILVIELCINYLNFLINKISMLFYTILGILIVLVGLEYFGILSVSQPAGILFQTLYNIPYLFFIALGLLIFLYQKSFIFLKKGLYLDDKVSQKTQEARTSELSFLNRFGNQALFLKNDLRMILRNKRPKKVLWAAVIFLLYGVFFYSIDIYREMTWFMIFVGVFITSGFLLNFGQFVPAWDSGYYKLLMSQNISYRRYIDSKWLLMILGTLISFILATPYILYGWKTFSVIIAGTLFNIGINAYITLFGGAYRRTPIDLNVKSSAFSNMQGFNLTQLLIGLPQVFLPIGLYFIPYAFGGHWAGVTTLAFLGILGLIFKNFFLTQIEKIYQKGKYKTIAAFEES